MIEVANYKIHYGYCSKCAEPVKLQRVHTIKKEDRYWKIIGHFCCSENGKAGKVASGAKAAFFNKYFTFNKNVELAQRYEKKTGKHKKKILPDEDGFQSDLFKQPVPIH